MGRKSKYSAKEKLLILREVSQYGTTDGSVKYFV